MAICAFNQLDKDLDVTVEAIFKESSLSDHVYSAMTVEECLFPMAPLFTICCYDKMSNSYGIIVIENKRFFYITWKKNTCSHTSVCTMMRNSKDRDRYPEVIQEFLATIESEVQEEKISLTHPNKKFVLANQI